MDWKLFNPATSDGADDRERLKLRTHPFSYEKNNSQAPSKDLRVCHPTTTHPITVERLRPPNVSRRVETYQKLNAFLHLVIVSSPWRHALASCHGAVAGSSASQKRQTRRQARGHCRLLSIMYSPGSRKRVEAFAVHAAPGAKEVPSHTRSSYALWCVTLSCSRSLGRPVKRRDDDNVGTMVSNDGTRKLLANK